MSRGSMSSRCGEPPEDVLDHDHRTIDQDAEVDRADRKQVGGALCRSRQVNANSKDKRNCDRHDQPGAHIVKEEDQDHDDQQHAAQEITLDDVAVIVDEIGAVIEGHDLDVLGQDALC